jgi:sulfite exporter TauE/SafE
MAELAGLTLLGILYGSTVCSLSCLPTLGPLLVGEAGGFRQGLGLGASFMAGKVIMYSLLGALAAQVGTQLDLAGRSLRILPGVVLVLTAIYLLAVQRGPCVKKCRPSSKRPLPFLVLGAATGIAPCAPLAAMMVFAAKTGSIPLGAASGLFFGMGLMLSPMILVGGGLAFLSRKIGVELGAWQPWIRRVAGVVLLLNGVGILLDVRSLS